MSKRKSRDPAVKIMIDRLDALESDKKKIAPRKGWSEYTKPRAPTKPHEPLKEFTRHVNTHIRDLSECYEFALADLELPEGISLGDLVVRTEKGDDEWSGSEVSILARKVITEPNPRYEQEMKKYQKSLEEWEVKKKAHSQEMKEWRAWVKQLEGERLEKNLANAEELLKAHGRLK